MAKPEIRIGKRWFGSEYGGFYACPDPLHASSIVYSFGVGEDITFDEELISQFSCTVYAFDPTPKSIRFMAEKENKKIHFTPVGIHGYDGTTDFFLPKNPDYVSGSVKKHTGVEEKITVPVKKFSTIAKELQHAKVDLLKMDIEGAEYDVIDNILASGVVITQILIEFHHRFDGIGISKTKELLRKMKLAGYKIAAISDSHEEYSFIKAR